MDVSLKIFYFSIALCFYLCYYTIVIKKRLLLSNFLNCYIMSYFPSLINHYNKNNVISSFVVCETLKDLIDEVRYNKTINRKITIEFA